MRLTGTRMQSYGVGCWQEVDIWPHLFDEEPWHEKKKKQKMQSDVTNISGNIVDVTNAETYPGTIKISNGRIIEIIRNRKTSDIYITQGFVDSHIHAIIEKHYNFLTFCSDDKHPDDLVRGYLNEMAYEKTP
ncbi:MAG: hypothetical protein LWW97_02435 [Deltaproteobacteria bacterium]|nr:hypothetical protein [Deltaproteobacteria bacterium]